MHITLNGREFLVQYPIAACRALEREMGKSVFQLYDDLASGRAGFDLMIALVWAGILHSNRAVTIDAVSLWLEDSPVPLMELYQGCLVEFAQSVMGKLSAKEKKEQEGDEKN